MPTTIHAELHMFGTLIESQAQVQRHSLGSVVSVVAHAMLVASAIAATGAKGLEVIWQRPIETRPVQFVPRPPVHNSSTPPTATHTSALALPSMPTIRVPSIMPTEIPPIDLTSVPTTVDLSDLRAHGGEPCAALCSRAVSGDTASPVWAIDAVLMQLREPPVPPRYPEVLRRAGIDGTVVVKFIVDTVGRVDVASVEILSSSHELFTAAVRETIARLRFNPATVGRRKVRASAIMPFHFTLK